MKTLHGDFSWPEAWRPDISATLMFIIRGGRILLIRKKRGIGAGKVNGPGGKLEQGETPLECVLREVREELSVEVLDPREAGTLRFSFRDKSTPDILCRVFRASSFSGVPQESDEAAPFWSSLRDIPYDRMWEDDRFWLPLLLQGRRFDASFLFEGDKLLAYSLWAQD